MKPLNVIFDMPNSKPKKVRLTDINSKADLKDLLSDVIVKTKKEKKNNESSGTS